MAFHPIRCFEGACSLTGIRSDIDFGVNFNPIPVNAPKCPFQSYHRDGKMRVDGNLGGTLTYHPNSEGLWANQPQFVEPMLSIEGAAGHWDHRVDDDHWEQPGNLFRKMTPRQRQMLFENTARAMGDAKLDIKQRHVDNCARADPAYGAGVAKALGPKQLSWLIEAGPTLRQVADNQNSVTAG